MKQQTSIASVPSSYSSVYQPAWLLNASKGQVYNLIIGSEGTDLHFLLFRRYFWGGCHFFFERVFAWVRVAPIVGGRYFT